MGKCLIFSAPSGAGKTTIVKHLLAQSLDLEFSISACTREKRDGEIHAKDYYFLSQEEFQSNIDKDNFIEWEEVYPLHSYGTLKEEIERIWAKGKHVIFDVDVVGGLNLKKYFGEDALAIFVMPPSIEALEDRLRGRGTESEERLERRLSKAKQELITADQFDRILFNDNLAIACNEAKDIAKAFLNIQ